MKVRLKKGHLLADLDGRTVFIDTGCPVSVERTGRALVLADRQHAVITDAFWVKTMLDEVEVELVHEHLDYVLGMDILGEYRVHLDIAAGTMRLLPSEPGTEGVRIDYGWDFNEVARNLRLPTVEVDITNSDGEPFKKQALFDTGCWLSFVPGRCVERQAPVGHTSDWLVGVGRFETPLHEVSARIGPVEEPCPARGDPGSQSQLLHHRHADDGAPGGDHGFSGRAAVAWAGGRVVTNGGTRRLTRQPPATAPRIVTRRHHDTARFSSGGEAARRPLGSDRHRFHRTRSRREY